METIARTAARELKWDNRKMEQELETANKALSLPS